jgi:CMP-2-keto-3-deoxyoctulosonic acid synthetase
VEANQITSLPVLSGIQSKTKVIKGTTMNQYPISMPTNLNPIIDKDVASNQNDVTVVEQAASSGNAMHFNEVPITFRSQLPSLPHARNTKANLARQVKRHNGHQLTEKII